MSPAIVAERASAAICARSCLAVGPRKLMLPGSPKARRTAWWCFGFFLTTTFAADPNTDLTFAWSGLR
jgi:hypothetical protein